MGSIDDAWAQRLGDKRSHRLLENQLALRSKILTCKVTGEDQSDGGVSFMTPFESCDRFRHIKAFP